MAASNGLVASSGGDGGMGLGLHGDADGSVEENDVSPRVDASASKGDVDPNLVGAGSDVSPKADVSIKSTSFGGDSMPNSDTVGSEVKNLGGGSKPNLDGGVPRAVVSPSLDDKAIGTPKDRVSVWDRLNPKVSNGESKKSFAAIVGSVPQPELYFFRLRKRRTHVYVSRWR